VLALSIRIPFLLLIAGLLPYLFYPQGIRMAVVSVHPRSLLDPYMQLAEESSHDIGFLEGLWRFRQLTPEPISEVIADTMSETGTELVP
jgi:hypothetical protein